MKYFKLHFWQSDKNTFCITQIVSWIVATDAKKTRLANLANGVYNSKELPYHVAIYLDGRYRCGGALISVKHVLTSANCVKPMADNPYSLAERIVVQVGSDTLDSGKSHSVARAAYHKDFSDSPYETVFNPNDIGVLTVRRKLCHNNIKILNFSL